MTLDEMQRLLLRQLKDGATVFEALKYVVDAIGLTLRPARQKTEGPDSGLKGETEPGTTALGS